MKGQATHLLELLEGSRKRFIIPVYQRNYDWKQENCKQLFDDLVQLIRTGKESHFFGSIVSYAHGRNEVVLIDGQQRVTTISLLIIAMINIMKKGIMVADDSHLVELLEGDYIVDKHAREERKVRLKPFRNDCEAFDRLIYKGEEDYINSSKVTINYRYFYDRIVNFKELTMDELYTAIDNLMIIDIELEPEHGDNPQLIFESLNSTGLDLTEADKIRNFILMGLAPDIQEQYYDNYWNKIEKCCQSELDMFVRDYLTIISGSIPSIKSIYTTFKNFAVNSVLDIEDILKDMLRYANAYQRIKSCNIGSSLANETAQRLGYLDNTVANPFIMSFLVYADEAMLEMKELESVLSCIETYVFRRLMCDMPTNALNKIFAVLHKSILKQKRENDSYSSVMVYQLEEKKFSGAFPKDSEFIQGFSSKNIYAMRAKYKAYIFERLENGMSKEKNDVVKNIEDGILTYEHIMPQKLNQQWKDSLGAEADRIHEQWLHSIANLTLSGYNSNYSNRTFSEKKTMENGFAHSGIRMNHYIAQFDKWTEEELMKRKAVLCETAIKLWSYPATTFVPQVKDDVCISLAEDYVFKGKYIKYFVFQDVRYDVDAWANMLFDMCKILYSKNPSILYQEASDRTNVWVSNNESDGYKKVAEGIYVCTASSTNSKLRLLRLLLKRYSIEEEEISFGLYPTRTPESPVDSEGELEDARTWLFPYNEKKFRLMDWLKNHDFVYWKQSVKLKDGDIVYIYSSAPTRAIICVFRVDSVNYTENPCKEEYDYWVTPTSLTIGEKYAKLVRIAMSEHIDLMSFENLNKHGLKTPPQGCITIKDELLEYVQQYF